MKINHIGRKIKELVERKKMSVEELASKLQKSHTAIYDIYKKQDINTELLTQISEVLDVPISYWFQEDDISHVTDNTEEKYSKTNISYIVDLRNQLKVKDSQIEFLQALIKDLQSKK